MRPASCAVRMFVALMLVMGIGHGAASAHGVGYRRSDKKAVPLEFYYSTGETMAYGEARVFSPEDPNNTFQSGRTDESGRYSFIPDMAGELRVAVKDPEGHMIEAKVEITGDFFAGAESDIQSGIAAAETSLPRGAGLAWRAVLGVSVIFNIASLTRRFSRPKTKEARA